MVKSELIIRLANKQPTLPLKDIEVSVHHLLELMSNTLSKGERIEIRGFGSFAPRYRPPRRAHNPRTGERVYTTAKYAPHFKPGKELRERVNTSRLTVPLIDNDEDDEDDF